MIYHCCDTPRRNAVDKHPTLNGIDYLEVLDHDSPEPSLRQRTLLVRLLKPVPAGLGVDQVRVEGGERVRLIDVQWVAAASSPPAEATAAEQVYFTALPDADKVLLVRTDRHGDFSPYTLRLVQSAGVQRPPADFDPVLSDIAFSFKVECPSDFDCRPATACPPQAPSAPVIDYLAKDYPTFRRLVLDRIGQLIPRWQERSAADLGTTLAELVAYAADQLSYQQDAIATEAYLHTARLRSSLRRHALLVDYAMHDGCNARAWLHVPVSDAVVLSRTATRFCTRVKGLPDRIKPGPDSDDEEAALRAQPVVFEPLHDATLHATHNKMLFHTWGNSRCCLPKGATRATLAGHFPALVQYDVLLFEEVMGPLTGVTSDANPAHRHVVRLSEDPVADTDPLTGEAITGIVWFQEDALPFPLCISSDPDSDRGPWDNVSVARGNMVLADHGFTLLADEDLGTVPLSRLSYPSDCDPSRCTPAAPVQIPPRFRPKLAQGPLTFAGTVLKTTENAGLRTSERLAFDPQAPAAAATVWAMEDTLPQITLDSTLGTVAQTWTPRRNLLNSDDDAPEFVVEVEHDGSTRLRFGDDTHGRRPETGTAFKARYRLGNGRTGNIGAETMAHVFHANPAVTGVRNPLPAVGGTEMEDAATLRRRAPQAFRRQERAVTPEDYAEVTERRTDVQRAAATLRWTGSWHTVFITVDRDGGLPVDAGFEADLTRHVDRFRMAGHDIEFNDPVYVALELELLVCVRPGHFRSDVQAGLLAVLGSRVLPDGSTGIFHPDRLSFGQTVYLSQIYAAARQVSGVGSVNATVFRRQGISDPQYLQAGLMRLARLEIPRLDNDANFPEHGVLRFKLFGGQ